MSPMQSTSDSSAIAATSTAATPAIGNSNNNNIAATIVVVAKCPIPGQCKTRLHDLLGPTGAADVATAMLIDVLTTISNCKELYSVNKILLYAPPNEHGRNMMTQLLEQCFALDGTVWTATEDSKKPWILHPVPIPPGHGQHDMRSSNLSDILRHAVRLGRSAGDNAKDSYNTVVLLGMDTPELPLAELVACCRAGGHGGCNQKHGDPNHSYNSALLCPAMDGGYGLLSIPPTMCDNKIDSIFNGVLWSHPLTALSQLKALTDSNVPVVLGPVMHDIDTPDDVHQLVRRLEHDTGPTTACCTNITSSDGGSFSPNGCLDQPSALCCSTTTATLKLKTTSPCPHTRQALISLGLLC